jgi:mono/diheme cytochrome c family protein
MFFSCNSNRSNIYQVSFEEYKIEDGFEIQLAASEPLIGAPVSMDFDNLGRMWIVEMRGYMPNLNGTGEDLPNGRISILEDVNNDGLADNSKVFLDKLVLPRAIALVYGGVLYAEPPDLWFVEIKNDKPGAKILVDSLYSDGGNVESQPNGLMMNIDNWIYSANSNFRYQLKNGKWIKEPTSFRGQWGISKDNFGRLYYNYNEIQLAGDYVLPNTIIKNPYQTPKGVINQILTKDQFVYPLHSTTVNRGSEVGILNKDSLLVKFTAACGPLIYRGNQFPDDYSENAFVCEPQGNLIKRNKLIFKGIKTTANQIWNDHEFIASTDEGFRPVNLFNGPDGCMYVVDMHRGIMQHRAYATPYYRNKIEEKKLDTLQQMGRILRIKNSNKRVNKVPDLSNMAATELIKLLKSSNGWLRDRAQQLLILKKEISVNSELERLVLDGGNSIASIHALNTLNGLNSLSMELLMKVSTASDPMLSSYALLLLEKFSSIDNIDRFKELSIDLLKRNDPIINFYLAVSLGSWVKTSNNVFFPILLKLSKLYSNQIVYQEAIIASLGNLEEIFRKYMDGQNNKNDAHLTLDSLLTQTINNKKKSNVNPIFVQVKVPTNERTNGLLLFNKTCATCHGTDGQGIENVAPPLKGSEFVKGSTERLALIILNGLKGPVHVDGKFYQLNVSMPAFKNNFSDKEISDIIEYVRSSFVPNSKDKISPEMIEGLRKKEYTTLTEEDLLKIISK